MEYQEKEATLRDYIDVIIKRKWIIITSVLVVTISSALFIPKSSLVYKASAFILVESSPREANMMKSIERFAKSYMFAEEVIRTVKFEKAESMKKGGGFSEWSTTEMKPDILLNSILLEEEESDILKISILSGAPKKAAYLANTVAKIVVDQSTKGLAGGDQASMAYVEKQLNSLAEKTKELKEKISQSTPDIGLDETLLPEEEQELSKLQQEYVDTKLSRQMAEAKLRVLEEKLGSTKPRDESRFLIVPQSEQLTKLRNSLDKLEKKRSDLLIQFTEEHPNVREVQAEIDSLKEDIEEEIRRPLKDLQIQIEQSKEREDTLKKIIETRFPIAGQKPEEASGRDNKLSQLIRDLRLSEQTYAILLDKKEKLSVDAIVNANKVKILRYAVEPKEPEKGEGPPMTLVAISLGLVLGLTAAFMQENMDTSLKTVEEVERHTGLPVIGVIPFIKVDKEARKEHG